ncbi:MAG: hypothetical protein ABID09_07380 [Candidatus Omnitrophota bacterium]
MRKILIIFLSILLFSARAGAVDTTAPFEIILVIPEAFGSKSLDLARDPKDKPSFHVLLKNISLIPQKIWDDEGFAGRDNLSFEMVIDGNIEFVHRNQEFGRSGDPGMRVMLYPGEYHVFDVYFNDRVWYLPNFSKFKINTRIRAVYANHTDDLFKLMDVKDSHIWKGRVETDLSEVIIFTGLGVGEAALEEPAGVSPDQ